MHHLRKNSACNISLSEPERQYNLVKKQLRLGSPKTRVQGPGPVLICYVTYDKSLCFHLYNGEDGVQGHLN